MKIGSKDFDLNNNVYVMGILNVTPDSFSDGGKWNNMNEALKRVEEMISEGASIIDVGGESTRPGHVYPGHVYIEEKEEIQRVVPIITEIKKRFDIPVSIDTYKGNVAKAAADAGADLINDIWGFKGDEKIAAVTAEYDLPCCLMHNRDIKKSPYIDFLSDVISDLRESIDIALQAGVRKENIITDPGLGFGKTLENNLFLLNNIDKLHILSQPILLGASRKSMIGLTLDLPVEERLEGTLATSVIGVMKGCSIIRVHDIKENIRCIKMTEAVIKS